MEIIIFRENTLKRELLALGNQLGIGYQEEWVIRVMSSLLN